MTTEEQIRLKQIELLQAQKNISAIEADIQQLSFDQQIEKLQPEE